MQNLKLAESYVKVKDMDKSVAFYEELLSTKAKLKYKDRWATIVDGFGLYRPEYDKENNVQITEIDKQLEYGNNAIIVFHSGDIEVDHERISKMDVNSITEIADINLMARYKFFHFKDPDDNVIEIGQYL
jgi:predicted enzyme related to lactoylglutathione lyase